MLRSRPVTLSLAAAVGALFVAGLAVRGRTGGVLLLVVAAALVILSVAAWPSIPQRGRAARLAVLALVIALALVTFVRAR